MSSPRSLLALCALLCGASCDRVLGLSLGPPDAAIPDAPDAAVDPDLLAYFPLDDLDGRVAVNAVGGNDARCGVGTCPTLVPGVRKSAAAFDGQTALLVTDPGWMPRDLTALTVTAWVRFDSAGLPGGYQCPVAQGVGAEDRNSWQLCSEAGTLVAIMDAGYVNTGAPVEPDTWMHVAFAWDGVRLGVYRDGALAGAELATTTFDGGAVTLGGDRDFGELRSPMRGSLDEVRIYRRALDDAEIAALATPPTALPPGP